MSEYQALYRAWRPERFGDIYGQEPITRTLKNQVISGRISHAYLFCGSRGTGKTTTAKVLSRALNCTNLQDGEPCGECAVCRQLKGESSLDVMEIDAASNNGVDNVRELKDRIAYPPTVGRYKIYIVDEVHMLSAGAFNALLKTLEEPPAHAVFILATTEPQKLPATILSRCQRYDFKRIPVKDIVARLTVVLEGIRRRCTPEALEEIAVSADGGMRDALSLMDMCLSYTDDVVDAPLVRQVLGSNGREFMFEFADALAACDTARALEMIAEAMQDGRDPMAFAREAAAHLRTILIAQETGEKVGEIAQITGEAAKRFVEQGKRFEKIRLMRAMNEFIQAEGNMRYVAMPRSVIELSTVKACRVSNEKTPEGLSERVEALEKQLREGVVAVQPREPAAPSAPKEAAEERPRQQEAASQAAPEAVRDDGFKKLFDEAVAQCSKQMPWCALYIKELKYLKTEGSIVYASISNDNNVKKGMLDMHSEDIDKVFSAVYGRPVKLNVAVSRLSADTSGGISARLSTEVIDAFSRENMEFVD